MLTKGLIFRFVRIIFYILYLLGLSLVFMYDAKQNQSEKFMESSLTEYFEEGTLFLCFLIFVFTSFKALKNKSLSLLFGGFFLIAAIREFDAFLDDNVFDGTWQFLVSIVLIFMFYYAYKKWKQWFPDLLQFTNQYAFGLLLAGLLITFAYSRLFGEPYMWKTVMEDDYMRSVKNAAEESIELLGYSLSLFGTIEYSLWATSKKD